MLKAVRENGAVVLAFEEKKKIGKYFCPDCSVEVVLKKCREKVDHFAHKKVVDCSNQGETVNHLKMKKNMYEMFKVKHPGLLVELEVRISPRRRADIVISGRDKKIVIECQHSAISPVEIEARNNDYKELGYHVIWVFHAKRIKRDRVFYALTVKEEEALEERRRKLGMRLKPRKDKRMPSDIRYMDSLGALYVMDDGGNLAQVSLKYKWGKETLAWCNVHRVFLNKFEFEDIFCLI